MNIKRKSTWSIAFSFAMLLVTLLSCKENDIKQVNKITRMDTSPVLSTKNMKVDYTENGKLVYTMSAPEMRKFDQPEQRTEFPMGFNVVFYDSLQHIKGSARANYAMSHDVSTILEMVGNVVIINNQAHNKVETEKMFWNRSTKTIYGDRAARIHTPEKVFNVGAFNAAEDFSRWNIVKPGGDFWVKDIQ